MSGVTLIWTLILAAIAVDAWLWLTGRETFSGALRRWVRASRQRMVVFAASVVGGALLFVSHILWGWP